MRRTLHRIAGIIALVLTAAVAPAQDTDAPPAPTRYEVELIVFRHLDQGRNTPEIPASGSLIQDSPLTLIRPVDPAISFMNSLQLGVSGHYESEPDALIWSEPESPADDRPAEPTVGFFLMDPRAEFPEFVPIGRGSMALGGVYERMQVLDAYEPVMHLGWIQTAREAAQAQPYQLDKALRETGGIGGTITLFKERYLHLDLELSLNENHVDSEFFTREILTDMRETGRMVHILQESRRIRGVRWHYFDHPLFGVIARIEKINTEKSLDAPDPGAS